MERNPKSQSVDNDDMFDEFHGGETSNARNHKSFGMSDNSRKPKTSRNYEEETTNGCLYN